MALDGGTVAVPREKVYEDEARDWTEYIDKPDKAIFLCYLNGQCAGRIVLHEAWNRYAFIEDLDVKRAFRRQGVGTALMERAKRWARERGLGGLGAGNAGYEPDRLPVLPEVRPGNRRGEHHALQKHARARLRGYRHLLVSQIPGNEWPNLSRGKWDFMQGQCQ